MGITSTLAKFISDADFNHLPDHTLEKAKLAFLDWLGVTIAGSTHESSGLLFNTLRKFSGRKQATVLGFGDRMDIFSASLLNGYFSHVLDYDDMHLGMLGHPSVPIFPALLSLGEWQRKSGEELILAFALGVDLECRLGEAVNPQHYDHGWHSTSTLGHFGSAVGAAKLLNLDSDRIVHAIGIAGTLASGVRQVFGTMCKPLHPGKAATDGLLAAILAEKGFTSSKEMLGGEKGFTSVLCERFDPETLMYRLGQEWKVDEILFKRHASCYRTHATIECMLSLRHRLSLSPEKVASIHCKIPPIALDHAGIIEPKDGLEGKFSQPFCAAVTLVEGKAMDQQFTDDKVANPITVELMGKTKVTVDNNLGPSETVLEIVLKDGTILSERKDAEKIQIPKERLLADLKEKFQALIAEPIGKKKGETIFDSIMNFEAIRDIGDLVKLCK
jgi:2-methylcitrate dehydratase PrpD